MRAETRRVVLLGCFSARALAEDGVEVSAKAALEEIGEGKWRKSLGSDLYPVSAQSPTGENRGAVAAEQSISPDCLGSREGEDGANGAVFHEGFQERVRQEGADRTLMSGLDKPGEALLKGTGHVGEKTWWSFARRSQQTRGYGSWAALLVLEVQKAFGEILLL